MKPRAREREFSTMSKTITVAVSTFRETYFEWVIELLKALEKQTIEDFDVIVIVNRNERYFKKLLDATKHLSGLNYEINVVFNPFDKGISHSRNMALKNAKTPYIAYTDDDAIPHHRWLEELIWALQLDGKAGAVAGPVLCRWEFRTKNDNAWFPKELYWIIGCSPWTIKEVTKVRNGFASNLALKRDTVLKIGGFSEDFGYNPRNLMAGEEPELGIKLASAGYVTLWNPNATVFHRISEERLKTRNIITRSFIEGKSKAYLDRIYGSDVIKLETNHLQLTIKRFVTARFLKSKALLLLSSMAVLIGYLTHAIYLKFKKIEYSEQLG